MDYNSIRIAELTAQVKELMEMVRELQELAAGYSSPPGREETACAAYAALKALEESNATA